MAFNRNEGEGIKRFEFNLGLNKLGLNLSERFLKIEKS
jgi:hypothetical protein